MSAAELKAYIDKVLGNSIRCLLPSYWWKRLFGLVIDDVGDVRKGLDSKAAKSDLQRLDTKVSNLEGSISESSIFYIPLTLDGVQVSTLSAEQIATNKESYSRIKYGDSTKIDVRLYLVKGREISPLAINSIILGSSSIEFTSNFAELDNVGEYFNYLWKHTITSDGNVSTLLMTGGGIMLQTATSYQVTLQPNKYCKLNGTYATLVVTLGPATGIGVMDNYMFEFTTPGYGTNITWPEGLKWQNGQEPIIEANSTYQVSIINKLAVISVFV